MYSSLQKIVALPDVTKVYCGHEYTLVNDISFQILQFLTPACYLILNAPLHRVIQGLP